MVAYLREWRNVRPLLSGYDVLALRAPPGPEVARLLALLVAAQIGGRVRTRDEAFALVRGAATRARTIESGAPALTHIAARRKGGTV